MAETYLKSKHITDLKESLDVWKRGKGHTWSGKLTPSFSRQKLLSSMWYSSTNYNRKDKATRLLKHKQHIDSLCKIVNPTVRHTLVFSDEENIDNSTNVASNRIVVNAGLIEEDDKKLDVFSGQAIHEKLHCIYSDDICKWEKEQEYELAKSPIERKLLKYVVNIIEDEYVERQLQKTCSGYVHYITSCKNYFFDKSDIEDESQITAFGEIVNTLLLLVRYPSRLGDARRKTHAAHIQIFIAHLEKGLECRENTIECITNIYTYLVELAKAMASDSTPDNTATNEMIENQENGKIPEDAFKRNINDMKYELEEKLRDALDRQMTQEHFDKLEIIQSYKSDDEGISLGLKNEIDDLEQCDYSEEMIDKNLAISRSQRLVSWQKSISDEKSAKMYNKGVNAMKSEISKLRRKIDLYGNIRKINIYNQKRGILDKRRLHRIPMGMNDVFKAVTINEDKPLDICVLVDESGSMGNCCMEDARNSAITIKEALSDNSMLDLWIYGHSADENKKGNTEMIEYHSPSMKDRPMAMGNMQARYENRDGNAIISSALRVKSESNNASRKLMLVLSDGEPSADKYRGKTAREHTKRAVKYVESQGWEVIQVGFSGCTDEVMEEMFTNYIRVEDTADLGNKLSKIIRKVVGI